MTRSGDIDNERREIKKTTRDYDDLERRLGAWLWERLPDQDPVIASLVVPETNGMSSETLLLDVTTNDGATKGYVVRVAPLDDAYPVFETYDFELQFRVMNLVGERTDVPVPHAIWLETDRSKIGSHFFVMDRIDGMVPPDNLPYPFGDNWLFDAPVEDQMRLQERSVAALAGIHGVELSDQERDYFLTDAPVPDGVRDTPLRRHFEAQKAYHRWVTDGDLHPVLERVADWLEANWPSNEDDAYLSWGDGRIGNMMFRDFEPVAVLDWEMASVAPREVDIAWMIFIHQFFEDIAHLIELPGMAHFMQTADVCATYEKLTGYRPQNMDWYIVYAALRHGVVMAQVTRRAVAFGETEMPDDRDDLIMHKSTLEEMLDGSYWERLS